METLDPLIDHLMEQEWVQSRSCIPTDLARQLAQEIQDFETTGRLHAATIGQGKEQHHNTTVRQTQIAWFDPQDLTPTQSQLHELLDAIRQRLNQTCFLSLVDFECHYAVYPPGAFYERHLDQFRGDVRRTISFTLYLNESWDQQEGGALRLYLDNDQTVDVWPEMGTFSMFLSAKLEHEVLPTQRTRYAVVGWMKTRGSGVLR